jgi:hypothetical protein
MSLEMDSHDWVKTVSRRPRLAMARRLGCGPQVEEPGFEVEPAGHGEQVSPLEKVFLYVSYHSCAARLREKGERAGRGNQLTLGHDAQDCPLLVGTLPPGHAVQMVLPGFDMLPYHISTAPAKRHFTYWRTVSADASEIV